MLRPLRRSIRRTHRLHPRNALSACALAACLAACPTLASAQQSGAPALPPPPVQPEAPQLQPDSARQGPLDRIRDRVREGIDQVTGEAREEVGRVVDRVLPRDQIATTEVDVAVDGQALRVRQVWPNSYASRLDLQPGDRIIEIDGRPFRDPDQFYEFWSTRAARYPEVVVIRDGQRLVLHRRLAIIDAPAPQGRAALGVFLTDRALGPQVDRVLAGGAADRVGITVGDYIVRVDNADTETTAQVAAAVRRHPLDRPMELTYQRQNHNHDALVRFTAPDRAVAVDADLDADVAVRRPVLPDPETESLRAIARRLQRLEAEVQQLRGAVQVLADQNAD